MPVPRTAGVSTADWRPMADCKPDCVFWHEEGLPFCWLDSHSHYIQLATANQVSTLTAYVEKRVKDLEERFDKHKAALAEAAECEAQREEISKPFRDIGESWRCVMATLSHKMDAAFTTLQAADVEVASLRREADVAVEAQFEEINSLQAVDVEITEQRGCSLEDTFQNIEVAVFGVSTATSDLEQQIIEAEDVEQQTLATLCQLDALVAQGVPGIDAAPAKQDHEKAQEAIERLKSALIEAQASDEALRAKLPEVSL